MAKRSPRRGARPAKVDNVLERVHHHLSEGTYLDTRHAFERKREREVSLLEVLQILRGGFHEKKKDEFKAEHSDWNYAIRGRTLDGRAMRVAVAFSTPGMLVITTIDLAAK